MTQSNSIYEKMAAKSSLLDAWRLVKLKKKAGGIDGVSVKFYSDNFNENIENLLEKLKNNSYVPEPYARINISKSGKPGETRPLSLPTINDKIVQHALKIIIEPLFNSTFQDISYAYRPNKGTIKAISRVSHIIRCSKISAALCVDIDNFFDSMDHNILLNEFHKIVDESEITKLIKMWLKIGVVTNQGFYEETPYGIAQGGIISPLLSNIYLNPFDKYVVEKSYNCIRYADNFVLLEKSKNTIEKQFDSIKYFLKDVLNLRLNYQKQYIKNISQGFVFLGIFFKNQLKFIDNNRIYRTENQLSSLINQFLLQNTRLFMEKLEYKIIGFENYYGKILKLHGLFARFNTFLRNKIIDTIVNNCLNNNKKPNKTDIKAMLSPIILFGLKDNSFRDNWIKILTDQCVEDYSQKKLILDSKKTTIEKSSELTNKNDNNKNNQDNLNNKNTLNKNTQSAENAVRKQKAKYQKLESVNREVLIETHGVFLGKSYQKLVVKKSGVKIFDFPLEKLETLNICAKGVTLSSDLIWACAKNSISIFFSDGFGMPTCSLQKPVYGSPELGLLQLKALDEKNKAVYLSKEFIIGKIKNQLNLLKYYRRHRLNNTLYSSTLEEEIDAFKNIIIKVENFIINQDDEYSQAREKLMGYEAEAAKKYWNLIKILLADDVPDYPGRIRKGAKDLVNSLLNYGYGFLYRQVWKAVISAGLNPKISFLHSTKENEPALVFDLVEEFRPQAVDRVVFSMITKNEILKINNKTGLLTNETRKKLITSLLERQGTAYNYRGKKILLKNIIIRQIQDICLYLKNQKQYRHFIGYY